MESESVELVKADINEVVRRHGVTVDDFIVCMKGGLAATKDIKDRDGELVETIPDWNVRHKFFSTGLELLGYLRGNAPIVNIGDVEAKREAENAYKRWRLKPESVVGDLGL